MAAAVRRDVGFALDSLLEQSGFEPLVPLNLRRRHFSIGKADVTGAAP